MKKTFLIVLFLNIIIYALPSDKAEGYFISFGVGPRIPIATFANKSNFGYGFNLEFSYTDNSKFPFFLFVRAGVEQYPGSQSFYKQSDFSNFSVTSFPINVGIKHFLPPLLKSGVLILPVVELTIAANFYRTLSEFKPELAKKDITDKFTRIGGSFGFGLSAFLMEFVASYNYFPSNQFVAFDFRIRIPLYVKI